MPWPAGTRVSRTWADVFTKEEKLQLRKRLVWGAVAFTTLSWCLLISINFGGYPANNHSTILAEDLYAIQVRPNPRTVRFLSAPAHDKANADVPDSGCPSSP